MDFIGVVGQAGMLLDGRALKKFYTCGDAGRWELQFMVAALVIPRGTALGRSSSWSHRS